MSNAHEKLFELTALPKGITGGMLTVTLFFAPNARTLNWRRDNLAALLQRGGKVQLRTYVGAAQLPLAPAVAAPAELGQLLQPALWEALFAGVALTPPVAAAGGPAPQRLYFSSAAARLAVSGFAASSAELANKARAKTAQRLGRHLRTVPSALDLLAGTSDKGMHDGRVGDDFRDVHSHFLRPGRTLAQVSEDLQPLRPRMATLQDRHLLALMAGYTSNVAERVLGPNHITRHLGLNADGINLLRKSLAGLQSADDHDVKAFGGRVGLLDAWSRSALATAPYCPAAGKSATEAHDVTDQASLENRLAAIAQEFGLLPFLGLVVDMEVPLESLGPRTLVEQALASGTAFVSAEWAGLEDKVHSCRTAIGRDGQPRARRGELRAYVRDGRADLRDARLSNLETHGNVENTVSATMHSLAAADGFVRGDAAAQAQQQIAVLRSGSMTVQHHFFRKFFDEVTAVDPPDTERYLEHLVIGVRPDVRVHRPGKEAPWRALMDREITYHDIPQVATGLELRHPTAGTRAEGYVPLARHSHAGSADSPSIVVDDTVFEWNGWNAGVPFPSRINKERAPLVQKTIRARKHANPRFRYGSGVEVSARVVLRDGSSISGGPDDDAGALVGSRQLDPNLPGNGFTLLRYEPLRAPLALLTDNFALSGLGKMQTATQVVLAQPQWGCGAGCFRTSRYLLAGEVHDLIELDKLGAFDAGARPTDTAFGYFERDAKGAFPAVDAGSGPQTVVRSRPDAACSSVPYHPDPMVRRLRLVIARQHSGGDLVSVTGPRASVEHRHELYAHGARWPHARPLRVDFVAAHPASAPPGIRPIGVLPFENAIEIVVPTGENFEVLVFPEGDDDDLMARQYGRNSGMPLDSPYVCEMLQLHVKNLAAQPRSPQLEEFARADRDPGEHVGKLDVVAHVDAGATAVLELVASWVDPGDNPAMGKLRHGSLPPVDRRGELVVADLSAQLRAQVDDMIRDGLPIDRGLVRVEFNNVLHDMRDNHRRAVTYFLRAQAAATLGRRASAPVTSNPQAVDWRATRRPAPPLFHNIAPAFRFRRSRELGVSTSVREQAISVFFGRDWGTSGPGELVGIVCQMPGRPAGKAVSQWGTDPTRMTGVIDRVNMVASDFISSPHSVADDLAHAAAANGITLYQPTYDEDEDAWRVDLRLNTWWPAMAFHGRSLTSGDPPPGHVPLQVAQPMLRLVATRYQPHAIEDEHASDLVLLDYMQLPSQRAATAMMRDGGDSVTVTVYGPMGTGSEQGGRPELRCSLVVGEVSGRGALVWRDAQVAAILAPVGERGQVEDGRTALRWTAELPLPITLRKMRVGLRLSEHTVYLVDKIGNDKADGPPMYQEVIELRLVDGPLPGGPS
jgi:hypothetical protein